MRRWYAPIKVSPIHRSTRSLLLCFEDKTKKSDSVSPTRPSLAHTREPGPRKEQSLPLVLSSQPRSKLKSCLLGLSCLEISICCSNAMYYGVSVTLIDNRRMTIYTHCMILVHFGVFSKHLSEENHLVLVIHLKASSCLNKIEFQDSRL